MAPATDPHAAARVASVSQAIASLGAPFTPLSVNEATLGAGDEEFEQWLAGSDLTGLVSGNDGDRGNSVHGRGQTSVSDPVGAVAASDGPRRAHAHKQSTALSSCDARQTEGARGSSNTRPIQAAASLDFGDADVVALLGRGELQAALAAAAAMRAGGERTAPAVATEHALLDALWEGKDGRGEALAHMRALVAGRSPAAGEAFPRGALCVLDVSALPPRAAVLRVTLFLQSEVPPPAHWIMRPEGYRIVLGDLGEAGGSFGAGEGEFSASRGVLLEVDAPRARAVREALASLGSPPFDPVGVTEAELGADAAALERWAEDKSNEAHGQTL